MRLRYPGHCRTCAASLPAGQWAVYHREAKQVECLACQEQSTPALDAEPASTLAADSTLPIAEPAPGQAGASARREYQRRAAQRADRTRSAHPRLGGLILALSEEPQSTRAWLRGAVGEEMLGRRLDGLTELGAKVLHDRRIPGSRANIDHLVIGPAGVFVIDAKRYAGRRPQRRVEGGILRPRTETLLVGRRDCTKLLAGLHKQLGLVRAVLPPEDGSPVHGMLCFIDADWPVFGGNFTVAGIEVLWPKKISERVFGAALLADDQIAAMHDRLATAFPSA